jgi:hypothetical protein
MQKAYDEIDLEEMYAEDELRDYTFNHDGLSAVDQNGKEIT